MVESVTYVRPSFYDTLLSYGYKLTLISNKKGFGCINHTTFNCNIHTCVKNAWFMRFPNINKYYIAEKSALRTDKMHENSTEWYGVTQQLGLHQWNIAKLLIDVFVSCLRNWISSQPFRRRMQILLSRMILDARIPLWNSTLIHTRLYL